jgi:hypothetical protein
MGAFSSEDALMKLLFLAQENITSKWNRPIHNWNQTLAQLSIIFGDRLKLGLLCLPAATHSKIRVLLTHIQNKKHEFSHE